MRSTAAIPSLITHARARMPAYPIATAAQHGTQTVNLATASPALRVGELSARCTASIVHGFAAMGHHPGGALLEACAAQAAARACEANLQSVSNTLWGFATLRHNPGDVLLRASEAAIVRRCLQSAGDCAPHAVVRGGRQLLCHLHGEAYRLSVFGQVPLAIS